MIDSSKFPHLKFFADRYQAEKHPIKNVADRLKKWKSKNKQILFTIYYLDKYEHVEFIEINGQKLVFKCEDKDHLMDLIECLHDYNYGRILQVDYRDNSITLINRSNTDLWFFEMKHTWSKFVIRDFHNWRKSL